jgi:uncharacterized membrane protein YfcA
MDLLHLLLLFTGGCLAGFLAGFFGVGGGIVLVPILLYYYQSIGVSSLVATHVAFGTSLFVIIFTSLVSAREYHKNGHVVWRAVMVIGLASVIGAFGGAWLASVLAGKTLQKIFGIVVLVSAVRLLSETRKPKGEQKPRLGMPGLAATGLVVGVSSPLAGVGGGVFSIPIMYSLLHFPLKRALGTSSATIVITALAAVTGYVIRGWGNSLLPAYTLGYIDYLHALPIIAGTVLLARFGAGLAHRTDTGILRKVFAMFLVVMAAKMLFF